MKIKKYKKTTLVLISLTILFIGGTIDLFLNSTITLNNNILYNEINDNPNLSTYRDQQIIWGNASIHERGESVAIDSLGNIYVTGNSLESNMDVLLVSFDKYGNYRWNKTWGNLGVDCGSDIVIDSSDNIYIAGQSYNLTDTNAVILKYDSSGNYQENITWGVNGIDAAFGIVLDSEENIFITGSTTSRTIAGGNDIFLAKYNTSGLEWETVLPGSINNDYGRDLAVDSTDNIYLVGYNESRAPSEGDIVIAKYNSAGDQLWNQTWNKGQDQYGYGIEVDSDNNVYVTGYNRSSIDRDIMLLKYNSSGHLQMETSWDGDFVNDIDEGWGIDIDSRDFIYIVGRSEMTSNFYNVTLLKFTSSLDLEWTKAWGGSDHDKGRGILIDDSLDNIYLTGITISYSADAFDDVFLLKFIEYPPGTFDLDSDADDLDQDGNFTLSWTNSLRADNYSLYQYSSYITAVNESLTLLEETPGSSYPLTGYSNGTYYFIVKADNIIGTTLSNCIKVEVGISPEEPDDGGNGGPIPGYNLIFLIVIIGFVSTIIIYRRLKLK